MQFWRKEYSRHLHYEYLMLFVLDEPAQARHEINGEGSGESELGGDSNPKIMSLQRLLSSEEGNDFNKMRENVQHFFDAPNSRKESNYLQTTNPSNYLESNLAALTPESAFAAPNAFNKQSGLTAGASGTLCLIGILYHIVPLCTWSPFFYDLFYRSCLSTGPIFIIDNRYKLSKLSVKTQTL